MSGDWNDGERATCRVRQEHCRQREQQGYKPCGRNKRDGCEELHQPCLSRLIKSLRGAGDREGASVGRDRGREAGARARRAGWGTKACAPCSVVTGGPQGPLKGGRNQNAVLFPHLGFPSDLASHSPCYFQW